MASTDRSSIDAQPFYVHTGPPCRPRFEIMLLVGGATTVLPPPLLTKTRSHHSKVMKHYGRLIASLRWALCQWPESLQFIGHRPALGSAQGLAPIHADFFVVFQRIRPVTHRTNSNLMNRLNFGRSSLSHSFHSMSAPATISSLSPREDAVQEVSHSMNVHFHFRAQ